MNINKLKGKMVEKGMNVERLAEVTNIERSKLYRRFKNCKTFTIGEVNCIKVALELTSEEATDIFFN